jgi:CubicO group peptidase (beta-lactamase class C family)
LLAAHSVGQQLPPTPRVDPAVAVDSALRPLLPANEPGATVIITDKGRVVFRKAYGMADLDRGIALKPEMVLRIGSVTKQFTAVAVMLLEQDGKLSLQDDIAKYFPEIKPASVPTTIEHLLRQRTGLLSYTSVATFPAKRFTDVTPQEIIASFKDAPRAFEPGGQHQYSNSNYLLAGLIVEKVSGSSYPEFLATRIFEPLGMSSTAYEGFERNGTKRVEGYFKPIGEKWRKVRDISMTWPLGAGGLVSTVDDLARWHGAIMAGKLLSAQAWERVFGVEPNEYLPPYGYGWYVHPTMGRRSFWHGGGIDGFQCVTQHFPDENLYIAVLLNGTGATFSPAHVSRTALEAYWKARAIEVALDAVEK